jgi:hypothetical protein
MARKIFLFVILFVLYTRPSLSQSFVKTSDIFKRTDDKSNTGKLNIQQDPELDTLISRYILISKKIYDEKGYYGMDGFRIQIYNSNNRNAREESSKAGQKFLIRFPDIVSYALFAEPGYYKIRVGDFRTRTEATRLFLIISREFPEAYIVPDIINFPDLNTK